MTDPKDAPNKWPKGLSRLMREHGANSLVELVRKKIKPKEAKPLDKPKIRMPYKDVDPEEIPD